MKKLFFLFACSTVLHAYPNNDEVTITGKLEGLPDGAKVTLVPGGTHMAEEPVAEAIVANGAFELKLSLHEPRVFYLTADSVRGVVRLMAAPNDNITMTGTFAEPIITGSDIHKEYDEKFTTPRAAMNARKTEIDRQYADISRRLRDARRSGDTVAATEIMASEEWAAYEQAERDFFRFIREEIDKVVAENATTFWGPLLLMEHTSFLTPESERHYKMLSQEAKNSFYGRAMAAEIFGITGERAPAFTAKDANGNEHSLEALLKEGKYVLLDFWASCCGPCRRFFPTLKELAAKYADNGLVVVGISTDRDRNAWLNVLKEDPKPWLDVLDESNIGNAYGVTSIPALFLIDPQGMIVFGRQNGQSVVDKLAEYFEK